MSNADRKLPVVADVAETSCGCDRRTVLGGLAAGALVAGCRIDDPTAGDDAPADAPTGGDAAPGQGFEECGDNQVCVDLTHPNNMGLLTAGGKRVITVGTKKIIIGRSSETEFVTMSAVCTHAGCTVNFNLGAAQMQCPCHGSRFTFDGTMVAGPANRPLPVFTHTFDAGMNLLTIDL